MTCFEGSEDLGKSAAHATSTSMLPAVKGSVLASPFFALQYVQPSFSRVSPSFPQSDICVVQSTAHTFFMLTYLLGLVKDSDHIKQASVDLRAAAHVGWLFTRQPGKARSFGTWRSGLVRH